MKSSNWFVVVALSVALVGCGGGGGSSSSGSGGGGGGGGGSTPSSVNLPATNGSLILNYLTGQARAAGDETAVVTVASLVDTNFAPYSNPLATNLRCLLNGYTSNFDSESPAILVSTDATRTFNSFNLTINSLEAIDSGGSTTTYTVPTTNFACNARVAMGRQTELPIYLDETMFSLGAGTATLDQTLFTGKNYSSNNRMEGFYADYVEFDISSLGSSAKPTMSNSAPAQRVYFSGDNRAASDALTTGATFGGYFEQVTGGISPGVYTTPNLVGSTKIDAEYKLQQPDPSDPSGVAVIDSIRAKIRNYQDQTVSGVTFSGVISNPGAFEMIVFPNKDESAQQDFVMIQRNTGTGTITAMYFGTADFSGNTFTAYPINQLYASSPTGAITGTLSLYLNKAGTAVTNTGGTYFTAVRSGTFTQTGGTGTPTGWPTTGRFLVFRA